VLMRRHFPMWQANLLQATIFVSFLFELGYTHWGPLLTIPFALLQGYIFTKTRSLTYVVIVHLLFDVVVFLATVHAHHPAFFPSCRSCALKPRVPLALLLVAGPEQRRQHPIGPPMSGLESETVGEGHEAAAVVFRVRTGQLG